jgi:hypothetical protein
LKDGLKDLETRLNDILRWQANGGAAIETALLMKLGTSPAGRFPGTHVA